MTIRINGKNEVLAAVSSLAELIAARKLQPEKIVLEYNGRIVPRELWPGITLNESDSIEIISFVGGG